MTWEVECLDRLYLNGYISSTTRNEKMILEMDQRFTRVFKGLGFQYVTLDLEGYRQGSLNEVLHLKK